VIVEKYSDAELFAAYGIDMSSSSDLGLPAGWGRVKPGERTDFHQHDEVEVFVIVQGTGEMRAGAMTAPVAPGVVVSMAPFEGHVLSNTGEQDLVFFDMYWRDGKQAAELAATPGQQQVMDRPVFVFSTPPTPNGDLHLGHLSGPYLGADAFVRFQRRNGVQAWHLTGSDDYQSYVVDRAVSRGETPARTAAHYAAEIAETLRLMDIEPDQYTMTNVEQNYRAGLQTFFSRLVGSGAVQPVETMAAFDPVSGDYLYESTVSGGCPGCTNPTNGNICEDCGEPNLCADLSAPQSRLSGQPARIGSSRRYCLDLAPFEAAVAAHHLQGRVPARLRELANRVFQRADLMLPITQPSEWGVPPTETETPGQVIWVWPEMSYGFLHGIEALGRRLGQPWQATAPSNDWKIVHFFGFDNSFYHSLLYPVLYQLAFPDWQPDIDYHVNEFYLLDRQKFSTSRRHAVWGKDVLRPETVDGVRYFLASTRPEGARTNFDLTEYQRVVEHTLIGTWQHWLSDLGSRVDKDFAGVAPDTGAWRPEHVAFLAKLNARLAAVTAALSPAGFSLTEAAAEVTALVADTVRFSRAASFSRSIEHWRSETRSTLALELAAARLLAQCAEPIMPRFSARLVDALGLPPLQEWPTRAELLPPGSPISLAEVEFFTHVDVRCFTPGAAAPVPADV
jgi:methionyl-tRNA synthetase